MELTTLLDVKELVRNSRSIEQANAEIDALIRESELELDEMYLAKNFHNEHDYDADYDVMKDLSSEIVE